MRNFQRKIEDFTCAHCGAKVVGSGYTNHCPKCLWSKHVDVNPGDRAQVCGDIMEPVGLELKSGEYILTHECEKCGHKSKCKISPSDDINALTQLSETLVKNAMF